MIKIKFDNIATLNDSFISEKNNFNNSTYASFSNGYISHCSDPEIQRMKGQLESLYSKINTGYTNIENYWMGFINDSKSLENSLKDFSSKCTNPSVNSYISSYVSDIPTIAKVDNVFNNQEVTISDSITDGGLNFTDVSLSLSDEETYNLTIDYLQTNIDELNKELNEYISFSSKFDGGKVTKTAEDEAKIKEFAEQIEDLKLSIFELEYMKNNIQTKRDLIPYNDLLNNDDFKDVLSSISIDDLSKYTIEELQNNYTGDNSMIDPLLVAEAAKNMYPNKSDYDLTYDFTILITNIEGADGITYLDVEKFATTDQKNLYHYLFKTQGKEAAEKYLSLIMDDINKGKGAYEADQILKKIELDENGRIKGTVLNNMYIRKIGLEDGLKTFSSGLEEAFRNNKNFTADEYKKMLILQILNEKSVFYDDLYKFNTALGNMLPVIVTSIIATYAASAYLAGGGTLIGGMTATTAGETSASLLMGLSCYGNSKHSALVNGSSTAKANIYGALSALSEVTLERLLGNIPGVSKTAKFTAAGFIKEGTEEYLQEWIDAGLRSGLLGQPVDWSEVPADAGESFLMGAAMSATFTGGDVIIKYSGKSYNVSKEKVFEIYEYVKAHDNNKGMIDFSALFGKKAKKQTTETATKMQTETAPQSSKLHINMSNGYETTVDIMKEEDLDYDKFFDTKKGSLNNKEGIGAVGIITSNDSVYRLNLSEDKTTTDGLGNHPDTAEAIRKGLNINEKEGITLRFVNENDGNSKYITITLEKGKKPTQYQLNELQKISDKINSMNDDITVMLVDENGNFYDESDKNNIPDYLNK